MSPLRATVRTSVPCDHYGKKGALRETGTEIGTETESEIGNEKTRKGHGKGPQETMRGNGPQETMPRKEHGKPCTGMDHRRPCAGNGTHNAGTGGADPAASHSMGPAGTTGAPRIIKMVRREP